MDLLAPGTIRPPKEHPLTRSFPTARKAIAISQVLSIDPFYRQNRSLLRRIPPLFSGSYFVTGGSSLGAGNGPCSAAIWQAKK